MALASYVGSVACPHSTEDHAVAFAPGCMFTWLKGLARCLPGWTLQMFQPCQVLWAYSGLMSAPQLQRAGFQRVLHDGLEICAASLQSA